MHFSSCFQYKCVLKYDTLLSIAFSLSSSFSKYTVADVFGFPLLLTEMNTVFALNFLNCLNNNTSCAYWGTFVTTAFHCALSLTVRTPFSSFEILVSFPATIGIDQLDSSIFSFSDPWNCILTKANFTFAFLIHLLISTFPNLLIAKIISLAVQYCGISHNI